MRVPRGHYSNWMMNWSKLTVSEYVFSLCSQSHSNLISLQDIVDTTPYSGSSLTAESIVKTLIGGINRRVDRKGASSVIN